MADVTKADLEHCGKMTHARQEWKRSLREVIESRILLTAWKEWDQGQMTHKWKQKCNSCQWIVTLF